MERAKYSNQKYRGINCYARHAPSREVAMRVACKCICKVVSRVIMFDNLMRLYFVKHSTQHASFYCERMDCDNDMSYQRCHNKPFEL